MRIKALAFAIFSLLAIAPVAAADLVETASKSEDLQTFVAALEGAGLTDALKGDGPFTVFAPTDDAFAALPDDVIGDLDSEESRGVLAQILSYHVVPGSVGSADLKGGSVKLETVEGGTLTVDGGSDLTVNGARIIVTDIAASNGVIHIIDAVLVPK